jgi:hypothetical protein
VLFDAPGAPDAWQWEVTTTHRTLVERDAAGGRLLRESGPLAGLRVTVPVPWAPIGRIDATARLAYGRLDYDGRTQAGGPLATKVHHGEGEAGLRWRPLQMQPWGETYASVDALWFRRDIAATAAAAGLRETSTMWLAGVGWNAPQMQLAGRPLTVHAQWRTSVGHRLHIDYGRLFDESSLHAGRRSEFSLGASVPVASDWLLAIGWQRTRQAASGVVPIYRSGVAAGTVFQPRIDIDDVSLTLSRKF